MIHQGSSQSRIRPLSHLEQPNYLSVSKEQGHPFCGNAEGWGPISDIRYDLTPCEISSRRVDTSCTDVHLGFLDVWISVVAVYGIFFGAIALVYLLRKSKPQPVSKNWHYYAKIVREIGSAHIAHQKLTRIQGRSRSTLPHNPCSSRTANTPPARCLVRRLQVLDHRHYSALSRHRFQHTVC